MVIIHPFRPWRYTARAGPLENLATQPYDTIPPALAAAYRAASPYNLVRLILPGADYEGAAARLSEWICNGILARENAPALWVYEQAFNMPESCESLVRRGFIGLGDLEDYGAIVHRHERTLDAPRTDRLEHLRHTRAQFGSISMMYPDPGAEVDRLLDRVTGADPLARFSDRQDTTHTLWRVTDPGWIAGVQHAMSDKPLVIVDGHHRYEAALQYRRERPECPAAGRVMMTFVSQHCPGLRTLAAHRVIAGLPAFDGAGLLRTATPLAAPADLQRAWARTPPDRVGFGIATRGRLSYVELDRQEGALNLTILHDCILNDVLGITPEAINRQQYVSYCRGVDSAIAQVESGAVQAAFLVEALRVEEVARIALSGDTLPQKSTDFYPKLASGLTIYRLDD
jgi:uncharacterized protein (DUF1015 family)